jgi:putative ABC transport system ATP-binding protein
VVFGARSLKDLPDGGSRSPRDVDLNVYEGEFVVLCVPSGSGKSTLLNILGGFDSPSGGTAMWRDHDLVRAGEASRRYRRGRSIPRTRLTSIS